MEFGAESCLLATCQWHIAWHQEWEGEEKLPEEQVVVERELTKTSVVALDTYSLISLDLWVHQQSPAIQVPVRI